MNTSYSFHKYYASRTIVLDINSPKFSLPCSRAFIFLSQWVCVHFALRILRHAHIYYFLFGPTILKTELCVRS